jgi:hypothetical protein
MEVPQITVSMEEVQLSLDTAAATLALGDRNADLGRHAPRFDRIGTFLARTERQAHDLYIRTLLDRRNGRQAPMSTRPRRPALCGQSRRLWSRCAPLAATPTRCDTTAIRARRRCTTKERARRHPQHVADGETRAEQEDALPHALADLKTATEERRRIDPRSPMLLPALRHEREIIERISELVGQMESTSD